VTHGGKGKLSWVTGVWHCSTCNRRGTWRLGLISFKKSYFLMNLDGDKLYMKLVTCNEIYNFVVQTFFNLSHLETQIIDIVSRSQFSV
jgi:hypothetical protein